MYENKLPLPIGFRSPPSGGTSKITQFCCASTKLDNFLRKFSCRQVTEYQRHGPYKRPTSVPSVKKLHTSGFNVTAEFLASRREAEPNASKREKTAKTNSVATTWARAQNETPA